MNPEQAVPSSPRPMASLEGIARLKSGACLSLRDRLRAAGWNDELMAAAEAVAPGHLDAVRLPVVDAWLSRRGGTGSALARLFAYDGMVSRLEAESALGTDLVAGLLDAGLLQATISGVRSLFRILPFRGVYVICDPPDAGADAVMGGGPTTAMVAQHVRAHAGSVLDLGCGAGLLALYAASLGAARAVGTDVNERAIQLARVNGRLNDLRVDFHVGDLLEPLRGERFDLVLAQPPYVPLPEGIPAATYLHGGAAGDALPKRFARATAEALAPGGIGIIAIEAASSGASVHEMLSSTVGRGVFDIVTLSSAGIPAHLQAAAYASIVDATLGATYRVAARRYADHLSCLADAPRRAITILRRRQDSSTPLDQQLDVPAVQRVTAADVGAHLRALELSRMDDHHLLRARLRIPAGTRLVEERASGAFSAAPRRSVRFAPGGIATDHEIGEAGAKLFEILDRGDALEESVHLFAAACEEAPHSVRSIVLGFAREGLRKGMVVLASQPPTA